MRYRKAARSEHQKIADFHVNVSKQSYAMILPEEYLKIIMHEEKSLFWRQRFLKNSDAEKMFLFLAEDNDNLAGFICFTFEEKTGICLSNLYVIHEHHGSGVACRLIVECIKNFPHKLRRKPVHLITLAENHRACHFYKELGGFLVGTKDNIMSRYPRQRFSEFRWLSASNLMKAAWHRYVFKTKGLSNKD